MKNNLMDVFNNGKYYNPANAHYNYSGIVNCDRCNTSNIKVCIGYNDLDLCMQCVHYISKNVYDSSSVDTNPKVTKYPPLTLMEQNVYITDSDSSRIVNRMMQHMYDAIKPTFGTSNKVQKDSDDLKSPKSPKSSKSLPTYMCQSIYDNMYETRGGNNR